MTDSPRPDLSDPCVVERMWRAFEAAPDDATVAPPSEPAIDRVLGKPCSAYVPPGDCGDLAACRVHHTLGRHYANVRAAQELARQRGGRP